MQRILARRAPLSEWILTRQVCPGLIGARQISSRFVHEFPLLVLGSFAIGFNTWALELAGHTRDAGRAHGTAGRRLIRAEQRVIDGIQRGITRIIAGQAWIRLYSCQRILGGRRGLRVESTGRQIGGLERTRLSSGERWLRLLSWRRLIPKWRELDVRINGRGGRILGIILDRRRPKTVLVVRIRNEQRGRYRVAAALAIALSEVGQSDVG